MQRKTLPWSVKQTCSMIQKGTVIFDSPIQRPAGQWKIEKKSLLIDSILRTFVPDVYAIQDKTEKGNTYSVIDGLQRLTTIDSYIADKWALTTLKPIKLESTGETFDISGLTFSQLPEEVQEEIKSYSLSIKIIEIEEGEDEEEIVEEIFYRLNSGEPMASQHLALIKTPHNVQKFIHRIITEHKLYTEIAHFPEGQIKKSDREMSVMQSIVLVSGLPFDSFAAKDIEKFFVENDITDVVLARTEQAFTMIANTFQEHSKFCSKINISVMAYMFNFATDKQNAIANLLHYVNMDMAKGDKYKRHTGAGSTKKEIVTKRVKAMLEICNVTEPSEAVENVAK